MEDIMKLQLRFTITTIEDGEKKVSKTFSKLNPEATNEELLQFAQAYFSLVDGAGLGVYLIKVETL